MIIIYKYLLTNYYVFTQLNIKHSLFYFYTVIVQPSDLLGKEEEPPPPLATGLKVPPFTLKFQLIHTHRSNKAYDLLSIFLSLQ